MPEIKQPADRKAKVAKVEPDDYFTFTIGDEEVTCENRTMEIMTFGWVRKNRRLDNADYILTAFEAIAGDKILDLMDDVQGPESRRIMEQFQEHLGAHQGE